MLSKDEIDAIVADSDAYGAGERLWEVADQAQRALELEADRARLQAENRRLLEALQGLKDSVTGFLLPALNKTLEALPIGHPAKQGWFVDQIQFHKATAQTDAILLRED